MEVSASITAVQYLYSYITKGNRPMVATVHCEDEIKSFSETRVTSSAQAIWQTLGLSSHKQSPTVIRLGCRLPSDPSVLFDASFNPDELLEKAEASVQKATELSDWFELNKRDPFANTLAYIWIPAYYVYKNAAWVRRVKKSSVLGRLYPANASCPESVALRMLLLEVKGCKSIEDVKQGYPTFHEAARGLGLISDSKEWMQALKTASTNLASSQFRTLFSVVLDFCAPNDPELMLRRYFLFLTNDFSSRHLELLRWASCHGKELFQRLIWSTFPNETAGWDVGSNADLEQTVSNPAQCISATRLSAAQEHIHSQFLSLTKSSSKHNVCVLIAPAGCGKTFLINSILTTAQSCNRRIVPCATSALAASLLGSCRTAHSTFKIPVSCDDSTIIHLPLRHKLFLKSIEGFIWDEVSMAHKWAVDAVDRMLQDIHNCKAPFGGVPMLFVGDFRQLLPVHRFAADPSAYCIKVAYWFSSSTIFELSSNIRAIDASWADFVLGIGNGEDPIVFPAECCVKNVSELIDAVWHDNFEASNCQGKAILTSTRADADAINSIILGKIPGVEDCALSHSQAVDCEVSLFPVEFVNTISISGLPDHAITLKKGAVYMIILNLTDKLFNGK